MKKSAAIIAKLANIVAVARQDQWDIAVDTIENAAQDDLAVLLFIGPSGAFSVHSVNKDQLADLPDWNDGRIIYRLDDDDASVGSLLGGIGDNVPTGLGKVRRPNR